jgi:putative colanic acid biosynthesis UDP-glucose lipid carrier transferase
MLTARRSLLKSNATALDQMLRLADPVIVVLVGWVAHWIYLGTPDAPPLYWIALLAVALMSFAVFPATGLYRPQRGGSLIEDLRSLASGWLTLLAIGVFLVFVTKSGELYSRVWVALWFAGGFLLQTMMRLALRVSLRYLRRRGYNLRHICIVGAGEL